MRLVNVYPGPQSHIVDAQAAFVLYELLRERPAYACISHKQMPTWAEHLAFIRSRPYEAWYVIEDGEPVGGIYLTRAREVGIGILAAHQGKGYATRALKALMALHPSRLLANVAPGNAPSHALFRGMGGRVIQHTYELTGAST